MNIATTPTSPIPSTILEPPPSTTFYTDISDKARTGNQESNLRRYVDNLNKKIDYAKWKQSLVLQYNYLPLKRITEKVQNQKINYIKKIAEEEQNCAEILSGKDITVQLDLFREFSKKLDQKLQDYQVRIAETKLKNGMLQEEVQEKRMRLKEKMRSNMETIRSSLVNTGARNKEDIISLMRSKSTRDRLPPSSITFDSRRETQRQPRRLSSQSSKRQPINTNNILFRQCLQKLVGSIQSMKSSQDIQSGIYLDIMSRGDKQHHESRYSSSKSKISETIHARFGSNHIDQMKSSKGKSNFEMDWQTFKRLNWKQIMGILMVKDKKCQKIKNLLKIK